MIVTIEEKYLQELDETGKTADKKHRFQAEVLRKYQDCIRYLLAASGIEALYSVNSLNDEALKGDKAGISSIRVNKQYRIEFTVKDRNQIAKDIQRLESNQHVTFFEKLLS